MQAVVLSVGVEFNCRGAVVAGMIDHCQLVCLNEPVGA